MRSNYYYMITWAVMIVIFGNGSSSAQVGSKLFLESNNNTEYPIWITSNNGLIRSNNWGQLQLQNTNAHTNNYWHIGPRDNGNFDIAFGPETGNVIGINNAKFSVLPSGYIGIGTGSPSRHLHVSGDALIEGDLLINGSFSGAQIDVSQITGLLGQGFSAVFPVVLDNTVDLEISGISSTEKVLIYNSLGFESERISTPTQDGKFTEDVGLTMEFPLEFETEDAAFISELETWFDAPNPSTKDAQVIIRELNGTETARWTFLTLIPDGYMSGNDGRTRFKLIHSNPPDNFLGSTYDADFGSDLSFTPGEDSRVEISGVDLGSPCTPKVEVDASARTLTLTFNYNEGFQILDWVESTVAGNEPAPKSMSVIETTNGTDEVSRQDYFEVRPIRYEHIYGFGLNTKLQAKVLIAYGFSMQGR